MTHKPFLSLAVLATAFASLGAPVVATADQVVTCESRNNQYHYCRIQTHGYVRMSRQLSKSACDQGRNWDYDRSGIWVDDGCRAEFLVEERQHANSHSDHDSGKVVAAAAGLAILGALVAASHDDDDKHHDENYHGPRHSSYVPNWMQGDWQGYNNQYGKYVDMTIGSDGRVTAFAEGHQMHGYVNDNRLYVADAEFYIERAGNGFNTIQAGNRGNVVHYERP